MSFFRKKNKVNPDKIKPDKFQSNILNYLRKRIFIDFPLVKSYVEEGIYFYKEIMFSNLNLICWNNLAEKKLEIIIDNWVSIENFIKKPKKYYKDIECSICFESLYSTDARTLSCGHDFHLSCLLEWTIQKKNCPMCRKYFSV
jgi:hypothetical protein